MSTNRKKSYILIIVLLVFLAMILKFCLLAVLPIGQDEWSVLDRVHAYERGELRQPLQNFHVHFLSWLGAVGANDMTQARVARIVMSFCFLGTCTFILLLGAHFLGLPGALFSVLCYVSLISTFVNGASIRVDTPATLLFMFALYVFVVRGSSLLAHLVAGLAMALACLFTMKSAIYLAVFAGLVVVRLLARDDRAQTAKRAAAFAASLALGFALLYQLHAGTLPPTASERVGRSLGRMFSTFINFYPYLRRNFREVLRMEFCVWLLLLVGFVICAARLFRGGVRPRSAEACLLALAVPVFSPLFFRNATPYFYAFILPPVVPLCGYSFNLLMEKVERRTRRSSPVSVAVLGCCIVAPASFYLSWTFQKTVKTTAAQSEVISVIHRMFPEPVSYIDGCGMISSFPKVGFFMSSAVMDPYLSKGEPVLKKALLAKGPLFLLANVPHLDLESEKPPKSYVGRTLLEEDWQALRSYFVHHWGPVWIAGKKLELTSENSREEFQIETAGLYTLETSTSVRIDGASYQPGDLAYLAQGVHVIEAGGDNVTIVLRWGDHVYRPEDEPTWTSLFLGDLG